MDFKVIKSALLENDLSEVDRIEYEDKKVIITNFYYDFSEDQLKAARAYANDESGEEEGSETWYQEFYFDYLKDLAIDDVGEIIEEITEDLDVDSQYVSYEMDEEAPDYVEFIAVFFEKGKDIDINNLLEELE